MSTNRRCRLVWIGCSLTVALAATRCEKEETAREPNPPAVLVAEVARADMQDVLVLTGRVVVAPGHAATLAPRVEGVLSTVEVRDGDAVRRGQVLARVDSAALAGELTRARAVLATATADAERKRAVAERSARLCAAGVVARQDADADRADATAAESARIEARTLLGDAERHLGWATLAAPFDGIVTRVERRAGEPVSGTADSPVVELATLAANEVAVDALPEVARRLAPGLTAALVSGGATEPSSCSVIRVRPSPDPEMGTQEIRLGVAPGSPPLPLGTAVTVRIQLGAHEQVPTIPVAALRSRSGATGQAVSVDAAGNAHVRDLKLGLRDADRVEVEDGLQVGELVVLDNPTIVADGASVHVTRAP